MTREEKLKVCKKVLEDLKDKSNLYFLCDRFCALNKNIKDFPEVMKYRPKNEPTFLSWWSSRSRKGINRTPEKLRGFRIRVMEKAIKDLENVRD